MVDALLRSGHEVVAVVSPMKGIYKRQHFGPRFWLNELRGWSMLSLCKRHGIEFRVVTDLQDGALNAYLKRKKPDLLLTFGWPHKLSESTLAMYPLGGMNIHPSLLPKLRGPDPLFHIVDKGAGSFGLSFHRLTAELDAGPLYHQVALRADSAATYDLLYCKILDAIFTYLGLALESLKRDPAGTQQQGTATFVTRFRPSICTLDPAADPKAIIRRTLACYSHHPRITASGQTLLTFRRCKTMPHRELEYEQHASIQQVGITSLDVNFKGRYFSLGGVRVANRNRWLSPYYLTQSCKPGMLLASEEETRVLAKQHGYL